METPSRALLGAALGGLLSMCSCSSEDAKARITSSKVDPAMTQAQFEKLCADKGGKVEIHGHCGGANSCRGMSYDTGTQVLTEHECRATNTCAGYSCVYPG